MFWIQKVNKSNRRNNTTTKKKRCCCLYWKKIQNPPKNRWIYIEDVLSFLVFNINSVNNYLLDEWYKTHFPEEGDYTDASFSVNDATDGMEKEINDTLNIISQNGGTLIEEEEEDDIEVSENNESLNRIIQSGDSEEIISLPNDQNIDKSTFDAINLECNLNAKFRNKLIEWRGKELTDMINTNIAFRTYDIALEVVNELCISFDEQCTVEQINTIFDEWLFNSNNTFPVRDMNLENDFIIWQNFYKHDRLRTLSLVALRLLSIGTSESNVERLISIHRYLIHDRMTNISPEFLLARLRMRTKAITDNYIMK